MQRFRRKRKNPIRIAFIAFFAIIFIIFIGTVGMNIFIDSVLFISNLAQNSKKTDVVKTSTDTFLPVPIIADLPSATNSSPIILKGSSTDATSILLFLNDNKYKEIGVKDNSFETKINLLEGKNTIYAQALGNDDLTSETSKTYSVYFKASPPLLEIETPADQSYTDRQEIQIIGKTEPDNEIKVNSLPVVVDTEGSFTYTVRLNEGENTITISAKDMAGNVENIDRKITYEPY